MGRKSGPVRTTAPLHHLLIALKVITYEKSAFSDIKILRLFVNTLTADHKHYMLNRDNLTQPIQMGLSQKEKILLNFFLQF